MPPAFAHVRMVQPRPGGRPRAFDVEVSSDGGRTWARLAVASKRLESGVDAFPSLTLELGVDPDGKGPAGMVVENLLTVPLEQLDADPTDEPNPTEGTDDGARSSGPTP